MKLVDYVRTLRATHDVYSPQQRDILKRLPATADELAVGMGVPVTRIRCSLWRLKERERVKLTQQALPNGKRGPTPGTWIRSDKDGR